MVVELGSRHLDAERQPDLVETDGHNRGREAKGVVHRRVHKVERLQVALVMIRRRGRVGWGEKDSVLSKSLVYLLLQLSQSFS